MANTEAIARVSWNPEAQRLQFLTGIRLLYLFVCIGSHAFVVASAAVPVLYREFCS